MNLSDKQLSALTPEMYNVIMNAEKIESINCDIRQIKSNRQIGACIKQGYKNDYCDRILSYDAGAYCVNSSVRKDVHRTNCLNISRLNEKLQEMSMDIIIVVYKSDKNPTVYHDNIHDIPFDKLYRICNLPGSIFEADIIHHSLTNIIIMSNSVYHNFEALSIMMQ